MSTIPFSLGVVLASNYMKTNMPPITNCGFGYLLLNTVVGLISVVMLTVAAKQYRDRERNDPPYNQEIVERVWADGLRNEVQYQ